MSLDTDLVAHSSQEYVKAASASQEGVPSLPFELFPPGTNSSPSSPLLFSTPPSTTPSASSTPQQQLVSSIGSPLRSPQPRQQGSQTRVRKKLSQTVHERGRESEVNLLAARDQRSRLGGAEAGPEEEELTELDDVMDESRANRANRQDEDEAVVSEEEKVIAWCGEALVTDQLHGTSYYEQFVLEPSGIAFRVGDSFRLVTKAPDVNNDDDELAATMPVDSSTDEQPSICKLCYLWSDSRGKQWALCECFYMPEDTVFGRKPYHGTKELLKGEYAERRLLPEDIKGKVTIEDYPIFRQREVFPEDVFYWRDETYVPSALRSIATASLAATPQTLKKRTKEERQKEIDEANRNAYLLDKHVRLIEKLKDRRRRSEARRLAEERKKLQEEEERKARAAHEAEMMEEHEDEFVQLDDDEDDEGDEDEDLEVVPSECADATTSVPGVEMGGQAIMTTDKQQPDPQQPKEGEHESSTRRAETEDVSVEIIEVNNEIEKEATTRSSVDRTQSPIRDLPQPSTQSDTPLKGQARKKLTTLSSLSARSTSSARTLSSLSQRSRHKDQTPIEVNSDDEDLQGRVTSVAQSRRGRRQTSDEVDERGSRWKMYTQAAPEDNILDRATVSLKGKPKQRKVDEFKFPSDDEDFEPKSHDDNKHHATKEEDVDIISVRRSNRVKTRRMKQSKMHDAFERRPATTVTAEPSLVTEDVRPEQDDSEGSKDQVERSKAKSSVPNRSFLVHPPKQVVPHSPGPDILRSLHKPSLSLSHSPGSSPSLATSYTTISSSRLLAPSLSSRTSRTETISIGTEDEGTTDKKRDGKRRAKEPPETSTSVAEDKGTTRQLNSSGSLRVPTTVDTTGASQPGSKSRRSSITSSRQIFMESDEIVEEVDERRSRSRSRSPAPDSALAGKASTGGRKKTSRSSGGGINSSSRATTGGETTLSSLSSSATSLKTSRRGTPATSKTGSRASSDSESAAANVTAGEEQTTLRKKRKQLEDELLAELTDLDASATSTATVDHGTRSRPKRKRGKKVLAQEDEEENCTESSHTAAEEQEKEKSTSGRRKSSRVLRRLSAREKMDRQDKKKLQSDDDEETEQVGGNENEEDELRDFIVEEGDEEDDNAQEELHALLGGGQGLENAFRVYIQYLISGCLDPDFVTSIDKSDRYFLPARRTIEDAVTSRKESLVSSSAWVAPFRHNLESLPEYSSWHAGSLMARDCEACKRSNHPATYQVELSGPHHDARLYWSGHISFTQVNESERGTIKYYLGKTCHARTKLFHRLHHYQYATQTLLNKRVMGLLNSGEKAERVVDSLVDDKGLIKKLYEDFMGLLERALHFCDDPSKE